MDVCMTVCRHHRRLVERIDTDGNKGLSVEEMVDWMVKTEKTKKTKSLRNYFREADRNSNGYVTLTEFAHTMSDTSEVTLALFHNHACLQPVACSPACG